MEDSLRRRRGPSRADTESIDTGRDLEPQPEVVANALGQLEQAEADGLWNPGVLLEDEASPAMVREGREVATNSGTATIPMRDEDGLYGNEATSEPDYAGDTRGVNLQQALEMATSSQNVQLNVGEMGSVTNEAELIPDNGTVTLDTSTVRRMQLDMSRLLEQNQLLLTRISQLEQDQAVEYQHFDSRWTSSSESRSGRVKRDG